MPKFKVERIREALAEGKGVREIAQLLKVSPAKVSEVRRAMVADQSNDTGSRPIMVSSAPPRRM
jgi:hypothetical protein